jgi:precorrin-6B methylase 2
MAETAARARMTPALAALPGLPLMSRFCLCLTALLTAALAVAQEKSVKPGINDKFENPDPKEFVKTFEGESREVFNARKEIVKACKLKPGAAVADVGAGTGLFTRLLAGEVGPKGKVYAVDIAANFLEHVTKTCKQAKITNVETVKCTARSCELKEGSIDVAFVCDTYHHFEFPQRTLASIHKALRPKGQLIVVDFHRIPNKSRKWILDHVRAGQDVFEKEIVEAGFRKVGEEKLDGLKENYFLRFEKVEPKKEK